VDLDPVLALLLRNYIGGRQTGPLFGTSSGLPLSARNIMRDSLHPILKAMGRGSAGFHIFRRFRESVLQMSEVRTLLIDYWMGHSVMACGLLSVVPNFSSSSISRLSFSASRQQKTWPRARRVERSRSDRYIRASTNFQNHQMPSVLSVQMKLKSRWRT
jgi:hypothetical protein